MEYIKPQNTQSVCKTREKETVRDTFFLLKKMISLQKKNEKKNDLLVGHRAAGLGCPVVLLAGFESKVVQ